MAERTLKAEITGSNPVRAAKRPQVRALFALACFFIWGQNGGYFPRTSPEIFARLLHTTFIIPRALRCREDVIDDVSRPHVIFSLRMCVQIERDANGRMAKSRGYRLDVEAR